MNYLNVQFFLFAAVMIFLAIAGKRLNKKVERNIMVDNKAAACDHYRSLTCAPDA